MAIGIRSPQSGLQGPIGFQGANGVTGSTGAQGIQGPGGASGYYGSFYDPSTQTNAGASATNALRFNQTSSANGISIGTGSSGATQIVIANTSVYDIQFSAQIAKTDAGEDFIDIWLAKNGTAVPSSNTRLRLSGNTDSQVAAWDWIVNATGGDYYEILWTSADADMLILGASAGTSPTRPAIPSVILSVTQIMNLEKGDQGIAGPLGLQGLQGSGVQGAQGLQGIQGLQGSGVQGTQGSTGPQGYQGTGVQGLQGPIGVTGVQGRQGRQGPDGIVGTTGTTGLQGIQGPSGSQGYQGTGTTGNTGLQGIQGPSGLGFQGAQGFTGSTGVQGFQGPSGLGFQGAQGFTGSTGVQGFQGPSGLGFQGATGFQGLQGSGYEGTTGATGSEGPTGAQGPTGIGVGLTSGGSTGQVLVKTSEVDYEIGWTTLAASGAIYQFGGTASFPATGSTAALYIDTTTNDGWYWTGSVYKAISQYDADLTVSLSGGKTFGKYSTGQTIPATGKTPRAVIQLAIAEALSPTLTLTSSTSIAFNQTAISNVINFSYVINSLGASISTVSLEWRRGGAGSWTVLSTSTTTPSTYTHTLTDTNYNTSAFNYRYIVTDTVGGTNTATLNITPAAYSAPTVSLTVAGVSISSPETNSTRERGNINTNLSGTITRNSANVAMTSYTLQYSTNNSTWVDIGSSVGLTGSSQSITLTNHNDSALFASTVLYYRVKVIDAYQTYLSSFSTGGNSTVTFLYFIFYGPSSAAPTTSANVRALGNKSFTSALSNPFNLLTGTTYNIFTVAMPATLSITSVVDLDALNADITASYILSTFNVQDAYGTNVSYKVYTMTNATPYGTSHRHQTTRS